MISHSADKVRGFKEQNILTGYAESSKVSDED